MNHLIQEKLISSKQHGFVNFRSTVTQLFNYLDRATEAIAEGKVVDVIYFDFAKAFDTVPYRRLLQKLESYGWGSGLDTIIPRRSTSSSKSGVKSEKRKVLPQGSVLGPYCLYCTSMSWPSRGCPRNTLSVRRWHQTFEGSDKSPGFNSTTEWH